MVDKAAAGPDAGTPPPEAFVLGYRLTAITRDEEGVTHVGIVEQKNKKSYLLARGELEDGLFIGDVEIESGEAQICKGGEKYWMSLLTGGVASNRAARVAAASKAPVKLPAAPLSLAPPLSRPSAGFTQARTSRLSSSALTNMSYAARKQLRDDLRRRAANERARQVAESQQLALDQARAEGPDAAPAIAPLPVSLADAELPALLTAAGATNRASLIALLEQIGYTNADAVAESEPTE